MTTYIYNIKFKLFNIFINYMYISSLILFYLYQIYWITPIQYINIYHYIFTVFFVTVYVTSISEKIYYSTYIREKLDLVKNFYKWKKDYSLLNSYLSKFDWWYNYILYQFRKIYYNLFCPNKNHSIDIH